MTSISLPQPATAPAPGQANRTQRDSAGLLYQAATVLIILLCLISF